LKRKGFLPKKLPLAMVRMSGRRPRTVLAIGFALLIVSAYLASQLRIESDFLALIPKENPAVNDLRVTLDRFGSIDMLLAAVALEGERDLDDDIAYADYFVEELRASPDIEWVEYRAHDFMEAADELYKRITLFMTPAELDAYLDKFTPEGARRIAVELADMIKSPLAPGYKELLVKDPLGVSSLLAKRMNLQEMGPRFHKDTGYLIDPEERYLLMLIKPKGAAADIAFSKKIVAELDRIKADCDARWVEEGFDGEPPPMLYSGGYVIALEESDLVARDMALGAVTALIGVVALFALVFRRTSALMIAAVPLIAGLAFTFGFAEAALGKLNAATSAFAALLIGLGIDFVIVLYSRYLEERDAGGSHEKALETFGKHTAAGVLLGAATTAMTFFAFLVSDFRGLSELGLLTGGGILILVVTVFLILPAMLTLREKVRPKKRHHLLAFGIERLCSFSVRRARLTVGLSLAATAVLFAVMWRVDYDSSFLNMRSEANRGVINQQKIMRAFGARFTPIMARLDGNDEEAVVRRARELMGRLTPLVDGETLGKVDSVVSFLPSYEQQRQVLAKLDDVSIDPETYRGRFIEALSDQGLNPDAFLPGLAPALESLTVEAPISIAQLAESPVGHLLSRYVSLEDGVFSTVIYAYPPVGKWRSEPPPTLLKAAAAVPDVVLTGPLIISLELKKIVWRDAAIAGVLGLILVYLFLSLDLGGPLQGLLALLPLGAGMVWMVGLMALLDLPINFMNIFVFTMIIGIGVDYGIHLIHRWQETGGGAASLSGTAKAIVIAALTTVMGFGSLVLSHHPGLRSMGIVAILGALCTALAGITFLPAILTAFLSPRSIREEAAGEKGESAAAPGEYAPVER